MSAEIDFAGRETMRRLITGYWVSQAIASAVEFKIPDILGDQVLSVEEISKRADLGAENVYRLLRSLATEGVFQDHGERRFSHSPLSQLLRSDRTDGLPSLARFYSGELYGTWSGLSFSLRTGKPAFKEQNGLDPFAFFDSDPAARDLFQRSMTELSVEHAAAVLGAYNFSDAGRIADIGGGHGKLLFAILDRYPGLRGVLFELPLVAERVRTGAIPDALRDRVDVIGGDFFEALPFTARTIMLKYVLHDFPDDRAIEILVNCRKQLEPGGKLLAIDMAIPDEPSKFYGTWIDLHMLVMLGGRERRESEFRQILGRAGFAVTRVIPTESLLSIVEAVPS